MPQRFHLTHRTVEVWLTGARALLALSVALALVLTPELHLLSVVGTLGMYAATDGVIAALSRRRTTLRAAWAEGVLGVLLGIVIMLWADTQRALLVLFCVRTLLVAAIELLMAWRRSVGHVGHGWLAPHARMALLAYAALSAFALALALACMAPAGYGALDLYACIAGQLTIWAILIAGHGLRLHQRNAKAPEARDWSAPANAPRPGRRRVSWT
jgi:uncharacterized membrane protein HdeD (DUF308 family)